MADLPSLNALRAFEAVVRTGSFRAAAESLFVTQSAVSHQIKQLEEWFGTPLFAREGNRTQPLPHAKELARALSLSFAEMKSACHRVRNHKISQPLEVAAIPSVAVCWLIPRLARFRTLHPDIDIRIIYAIHGRDVTFRDADFAFVFSRGRPTVPDMEVKPFLPGDSVPVCSPLLAIRRAPGDPAQTIPALGLLHDTDLSGWQAWLTLAGAADCQTPPGPVFEDFNLLRAAVLSGQGVALCPMSMIRPDLEAGHLVCLSELTVISEWGYFLLQKPAAEQNEKSRAFGEWIMAERDRSNGPAP
ncbi:MAG: LysR substrate-binding domain-containing protein [Paracoccus sp. (in: a-proteobacteria)]|nr:LysR substrate-binding domain-containing protein [Paracoccus sp. (in: a-proteobacteria)]